MLNNIKIVITGGTILMGNAKDPSKDIATLKPLYNIEHFFYASKVMSSNLSDEEKKILLNEIKSTQSSHNSPKEIFNALKSKIDDLEEQEYLNFYKNIEFPFKDPDYKGTEVTPGLGLIDSIDFDFSSHYLTLFNKVKSLMQEGNSVILFGGTDTLEFYAAALSHHLKYFGLLDNSTIIFLTSMYPFQEDMEVNVNFFNSSLVMLKRISEKKNGIENGAFILSPDIIQKNLSSDVIGVKFHDVFSGFIKSSFSLKDSFRSTEETKYSIKFEENAEHSFDSDVNDSCIKEESHKCQLTSSDDVPKLLKVSAVFLLANNISILENFLNKVLFSLKKGEKFFDYIPIELDLDKFSLLSCEEQSNFCNLVRELKEKGAEVVFINDISLKKSKKYTNDYTLSPEFNFSEYKDLLSKIKEETECIFVTRPTIEVYSLLKIGLKSFLEKHSYPNINMESLGMELNLSIKSSNSENNLFVKYIADIDDFKSTLCFFEKEKIIYSISALAGKSLPKKCRNLIDDKKTDVFFRYNGYSYKDLNGKIFKEGENQRSIYSASIG